MNHNKKHHEVEDALGNLKGQMPTPRTGLSEDEKDKLISKIGPKTSRNILSMRGKVVTSRIPFLFSSIDTQAVVDLLANDMEAALERANIKSKTT